MRPETGGDLNASRRRRRRHHPSKLNVDFQYLDSEERERNNERKEKRI